MFLGAADVSKLTTEGSSRHRTAGRSFVRQKDVLDATPFGVLRRGRGWYERQVIGGAVLDVFPLRVGRVLNARRIREVEA